MTDANFDNLLEQLRSAADASYERGYQVGYRAALKKIMSNVQSDPLVSGEATPSDIAVLPREEQGQRPRAPKGLADELVEKVLAANPGLTMPNVERTVHSLDARVSAKTVYNTLMKWERAGRKFRRHSGKWYRIGDLPTSLVVNRSPSGETGGQQPPESLTLYSQGDPIQRDQGGGT